MVIPLDLRLFLMGHNDSDPRIASTWMWGKAPMGLACCSLEHSSSAIRPTWENAYLRVTDDPHPFRFSILRFIELYSSTANAPMFHGIKVLVFDGIRICISSRKLLPRPRVPNRCSPRSFLLSLGLSSSCSRSVFPVHCLATRARCYFGPILFVYSMVPRIQRFMCMTFA